MSRIPSQLDTQQKQEMRQLASTLLELQFEHKNRSLKDVTKLKKIRRQRAQLLTRVRTTK
ncbi:hypothetical protein HZA86_02170 [Candidatus Uhrbacteria bacterium]|nr:hypothetical protein [Candidatus Uhrbacteria bacterium]